MKMFAVFFRRGVLFLAFAVLCPVLHIQGQSLQFVPLNGDTIVRDEATETIDMFIEAFYGNRKFWGFDEDNLLVEEQIGTTFYPLEIVFQGKIDHTKAFGEREVFQLKTRSKKNYHRGARTYRITWHVPDSSQVGNREILDKIEAKKDWTVFKPFSLVEYFSFWDLLLVCLTLLALLLYILSELIPMIQVYRFKQKYVFPYSSVQKSGERKLNPITGRPLNPNELVVKKCDLDICGVPFKIWQQKNYKCLHCPKKCQGNLNLWSRKFFSQMAGAKKLNWLFFGAAGGAIAWLTNIAYDVYWSQYISSEGIDYAFVGAALGFGFALMLSWVEEKGQSRSLSVLRILLRTIIGMGIGAALFYGSSFLAGNLAFNILTWLLFCSLLGLILSINSSIPWNRALISGLVAGGVSALIYYLIPLLSPNPEASLVKMLTLIITGAVLGHGIIQIIKRLDNIELQVVSPSYRSGLVYSLDNFLKSGSEVVIGRAMKKCTVRVKWEDDQVLDQHAKMQMSGEKILISPLDDAEVWVNDERLTHARAKELSGGELIKLGRSSKTVFRYIQKESTK